MFFDDWEGIWRTVVVGVLAYLVLVAMLRTSGKRTLAKMNAFDLVVTVALGSTLATILLTADVALAEGATAFAVLIGLQFVVAAAAVASRGFRDAVKSTPRALVVDGAIDDGALRDERVSREEVTAAIRGAGFGSLDAIAAVVLETDGSFSILSKEKIGDRSAFDAVRGAEPRSER